MTKVSKKSGTVSVPFRMVIFRVTTGITILGMLIGGLSQFLRADYQVRVFEQLGYPLYAMSIIGLGKILGAISLSIPGMPPLFKTSAYAGLVFVTTGAVISHIIAGSPMDAVSPLIVAGIAITSCFLNPSQKVFWYSTTT